MGKFKENMDDLVSAAVGPTLDVVSDVFIEGVAGSVIPGVGNMILAYKQNRMERRVEETLKLLVERQDEFNTAIANLEDEINRNEIKGKYFEMLLDYSIDEPQEEKIKYLVNGYINVARIQHPQEDVVRSFYDTLKQMNLLDIRVFRLYVPSDTNDNAYMVMDDYQIDAYQYNMVREKLARLGLIYSKNDLQRDENTDAIVSYLEDLNKGRKNVRLRVKKVSRSESYRISSYGNRFFKFIEAEYGEEASQDKDQETYEE